jgi:hypothetical protein
MKVLAEVEYMCIDLALCRCCFPGDVGQASKLATYICFWLPAGPLLTNSPLKPAQSIYLALVPSHMHEFMLSFNPNFLSIPLFGFRDTTLPFYLDKSACAPCATVIEDDLCCSEIQT